MTIRRTLACLLFAAPLLTGCISLGDRDKTPARLLTLTPRSTLAADASARSTATATALVVMVPVVPQALATDRLAVDTGRAGIAYLENARWADQPARLFADLLTETVAARTGRVVLDRRDYALAPGARLTGRLSAFGLDAPRGEVVILYDATLAPGAGKPVATRRFEARVATPSERTEAVAGALDTAANDIAEAVAGWVASQD